MLFTMKALSRTPGHLNQVTDCKTTWFVIGNVTSKSFLTKTMLSIFKLQKLRNRNR